MLAFFLALVFLAFALALTADFLSVVFVFALVDVDFFLATLDLVVFRFLSALDLTVVFLLEFFDFPGNARQWDLVFLPFLSTDDLRQVHSLLFDEHIELLKPEHWLAALAEPAIPKPNIAITNNKDLLIFDILSP